MAAEVYEDSLELEIGILEAVLPDSGQYLSSAYPYPSLRPTGRVEKRQFRTIVLENPYLRATILPDLGGRILRLLDKRTNTEIFPQEPLLPVEGGLRGVELPYGIQIRYTADDRLNSMGTVNYQLVPAVDEEDDTGVWIGEVSGPLSFNALISLSPDALQLDVELRMFNRVIGDSPYNGGLSIGCATDAYYSAPPATSFPYEWIALTGTHAGVTLKERSAHTWAPQMKDRRLQLNLFAPGTQFALSARQLHTSHFVLRPSADSERSLNSPASADLQLSLEQREPIDISASMDTEYRKSVRSSISFEERTGFLMPSLRYEVHLLDALGKLDNILGQLFSDEELEQALLYNGEDHLAWWAKAMGKRIRQTSDGESSELLNAHYLAPLEPALRGEGFLSQPIAQGREANPILKPLEETPETFVEIACQLLDLQLISETSRFIDEALRHVDLPMLRYLQAYCLMFAKMDVEAAMHVAAAAKLPFGGPFPWRSVELRSLRILNDRFASDQRLNQYLDVAERFSKSPQ